MPTLHQLRIIIKQTHFFVEDRDSSKTTEYVIGLLEPLETMNVKGDFEVTIGWWLTDGERDLLGEVPFRIVETGERRFTGMRPHNRKPCT